jgi:RNA-directed DNA polymerase
MAALREIMTRLGLSVNERKTRIARVPEDHFDFLGYTIGRFYGKGGVPYLGTRPSTKAVRKLLARVHEETSSQWNWQTPAKRIAEINPILRGWCAYFDQGPVARVYRLVRRYTERRLRRWLMRRQQKRGTGYRQYPDRYLYDTLGLFMPHENRAAVTNAKA